MNPVTIKNKTQAIVYDADVLPSASPGLFDPETWRRDGGLIGSAPGRGTSHFIEATFGRAVLREFLRGGWVAHFSRDRYLFTGFENSRPFREFHLLQAMHADGLRVPAPIGAICSRHVLTSSGALITRRIEAARPLPDRFNDANLDWAAIGAALRAFHAAGVRHADLNARNILVEDRSDQVWLLDFDRSQYTPGSAVDGRVNLARLKRSLQKLWPQVGPELGVCWTQLLRGYGE